MSPPPKLRRELFPLYKGNKLDSPRNNQGSFLNCHNKQDMVSWMMKGDLPSLSLDTKDGLDNQTGPSPSLSCSCPSAFYQCQMAKSDSRLSRLGGPALDPRSHCKDILLLSCSSVYRRRSPFLSPASWRLQFILIQRRGRCRWESSLGKGMVSEVSLVAAEDLPVGWAIWVMFLDSWVSDRGPLSCRRWRTMEDWRLWTCRKVSMVNCGCTQMAG